MHTTRTIGQWYDQDMDVTWTVIIPGQPLHKGIYESKMGSF